MLRRHRGHRGRGSLSSSHSKRTKSRKGSNFNPYNEDSVASSQNIPPDHQALPPVVLIVPAYMHMPVLPTNGTVEVLRRQDLLLNNLRVELIVGHHQEILIDERVCILERRHRISACLPPHLESPRRARASYNYKYRERNGNYSKRVELRSICICMMFQEIDLKGVNRATPTQMVQ